MTDSLDYKKMIESIDKLVNTDFSEDMSYKANIRVDGKFNEISQEDARDMANIIGQVYLISHAAHCRNCQLEWIKKD